MSSWAFDPNILFPDAEQTIKGMPKGYVFEPETRDDVCGVKSAVWGMVPDPLKVQGCSICLMKFLDGSAVVVRYRTVDIYIGPEYARRIYYLDGLVKGG